MTNELTQIDKAVNRPISIKPSLIARIEKLVDITRYGNFSQFVVDAIVEKLEREERTAIEKAS